MIILCCVCVWHALAGSVVCYGTFVASPTPTATPTPTTPLPTSSASTATPNATSNCPAKPRCVASPQAITIDYIALGILASVYIGFHIVFLVLINYVVSCPYAHSYIL